MIVTKRESMTCLIHDTSPTIRHSLQQSHNRACIMDSEMPYFLAVSCTWRETVAKLPQPAQPRYHVWVTISNFYTAPSA